MIDIEQYPRSEWEHLIDEWTIGRNAERDRAILKRHLLDGICYEPLAEEFDLSTQHVKAIVKKRKSNLFRHVPG